MGMPRKIEEKQSFYDELKGEWEGDVGMCLVDINGHIGRHIDGVHGWYSIGQRNI